jgi:hypothetical protein
MTRRPSRRAARAWILTGTVVLLGLLVATPALAQSEGADGGDDDQVVLHGELLVPEGETVGTAVIFDGPARIEGTVSESLVVFHGRVEITGTVRRDVVVFDGDVVVREGAEVGGNLVTQSTPRVESGATVGGEQQSIASGTDLDDLGLAGRFAWWLAYSISTLILGVVLLLLAPGLDPAITWAARARTGASIGVGLLTFIALPIVAVLFLVTIVGIPLGIFLLLGLALFYTVAYVAGAHAIGRFVIKEPRSRYLAFLVGWGLVRVLALIPIVGGVLWTLVTIFGLGALLIAARRGDRRETMDPGMPPPPAPVPALR